MPSLLMVVCHGIPDASEDDDIVNIDVTVIKFSKMFIVIRYILGGNAMGSRTGHPLRR